VAEAPVVRGSAEHEATVSRLADFLARHERGVSAYSCWCGWQHTSVPHVEHVAALMAAQRPWEGERRG